MNRVLVLYFENFSKCVDVFLNFYNSKFNRVFDELVLRVGLREVGMLAIFWAFLGCLNEFLV